MKWPHKGLSLILISLSLLFVGFSAAVAQEELDENLETEEGFYGEGEEDESAVASEEAADSELVKND